MKKSLFFGLAALFAAGLASCSQDDLSAPTGDKPLDSDQSFFVNINVASNATRGAGDYEYDPDDNPNFDDGTGSTWKDSENNVNTIYFVFYDENKTRVATTQVMRDNGTKYPGTDESQNSIYAGVVQVDVKQGMLKPRYVLCFINPITATNFEINPNFATLDAVERTTRGSIIDSEGNFAMSKSVYYGTNRVTKEENVKIIATPIEDTQLFPTWDAASDAVKAGGEKGAENILDIYVERYAAKVSFQIDSQDAIKGLNINGQTLTFVPEYWAVNAYESTTYAVKSFLSDDMSTDLSYHDIETALCGGTYNVNFPIFKWNSPEYHRSYWAQSPAYYKKEYPRNADDINDKNMGFMVSPYYALGYYSYKEMADQAEDHGTEIDAKARKVTPGSPTFIYARENTIAGKAIRDAAGNPLMSAKAAIPSAVLVGHYKLGNRELDDDEFIYVMGNKNNGYTLFESEDKMRDYFMNSTIHFSKNAAGTDLFFYYGNQNYQFLDPNYKDYFVIEHPRYEVRNEIKNEKVVNEIVLDSRFVTIQIDPEKIGEGEPLWALIDGEYVQVTPENVNDVNRQMLYAAGTVQGYKGGKCYYSIPIKHLGYYRDKNPNAEYNPGDNNFDWQEVVTGDFGLVRNHSYTIEVSKIEGLGNGIPNPEDPIVPPTDPDEYFIGARLIILNWAVVPTQHVVL